MMSFRSRVPATVIWLAKLRIADFLGKKIEKSRPGRVSNSQSLNQVPSALPTTLRGLLETTAKNEINELLGDSSEHFGSNLSFT